LKASLKQALHELLFRSIVNTMPADISALEGSKLFERFGSDDSLWWGLFSYEGAAGKQRVFCTALGDSSVEDLHKYLKADQVSCLLRCSCYGLATCSSAV